MATGPSAEEPSKHAPSKNLKQPQSSLNFNKKQTTHSLSHQQEIQDERLLLSDLITANPSVLSPRKTVCPPTGHGLKHVPMFL